MLCLASSGATRKAAEELARLKLEPPPISLADPLGLDIATLNPRLLKDAAFAATGSARRTKLPMAAAAYEAVYNDAKRAGNRNAYYRVSTPPR